MSRDELFRRVLRKPMTGHLADYWIAGTGIARICDRLNISPAGCAIELFKAFFWSDSLQSAAVEPALDATW
jgi:hypothetical protein